MDGYRCAAVRRVRSVRLWSWQGTDLTDPFPPDITRALLAQMARDCVLDGELVVWAGHAFSFDALQ
jgi:ATP-dependent DNA ligase